MRKDKLFRASEKLEELEELKNLPHNAGDAGLIPDWGTKIPQAAWLKRSRGEQCCYEHLCTNFSLEICFYSLGLISKSPLDV